MPNLIGGDASRAASGASSGDASTWGSTYHIKKGSTKSLYQLIEQWLWNRLYRLYIVKVELVVVEEEEEDDGRKQEHDETAYNLIQVDTSAPRSNRHYSFSLLCY